MDHINLDQDSTNMAIFEVLELFEEGLSHLLRNSYLNVPSFFLYSHLLCLALIPLIITLTYREQILSVLAHYVSLLASQFKMCLLGRCFHTLVKSVIVVDTPSRVHPPSRLNLFASTSLGV